MLQVSGLELCVQKVAGICGLWPCLSCVFLCEMAFYCYNDERCRYLEARKWTQVGGLPLLSDQTPSRDLQVKRFGGLKRMHVNYNMFRPMACFGWNMWGGGKKAAHCMQTLKDNRIQVFCCC